MAKKSNFLILISLQPDGVNLWYFKLRLLDLTEIIVWNVYGLRHWVEKIKGLENQSLWQGHNTMTLSESESEFSKETKF